MFQGVPGAKGACLKVRNKFLKILFLVLNNCNYLTSRTNQFFSFHKKQSCDWLQQTSADQGWTVQEDQFKTVSFYKTFKTTTDLSYADFLHKPIKIHGCAFA